MTAKEWEDKYNQMCSDISGRDYHLILAMVKTTSLLNPDYKPAKPNDIVECVKELIHTSLKMEAELLKTDDKHKMWNDSMEILSEWNVELEGSIQQLEQENKELKFILEELEK